MTTTERGRASSSGGIVLLARGARDVFEGRTKAEARRKRDAAIPDASAFDADGRLCVTLLWRDRKRWQVRRNGQWVDVCRRNSDRDED